MEKSINASKHEYIDRLMSLLKNFIRQDKLHSIEYVSEWDCIRIKLFLKHNYIFSYSFSNVTTNHQSNLPALEYANFILWDLKSKIVDFITNDVTYSLFEQLEPKDYSF